MPVRIARFVSATVITAALVFPGSALAADPTPAGPPAAVSEWQVHLEHMRSMAGNLGTHVSGCVEMHGSMAGQLGPNGSMVEMMAGGMMR
jgi:TRAP-type C4-dicarboxylate transport system substrate-binding protein